MSTTKSAIDPSRIARALAARGLGGAELAIVLGSGLGAFADELEDGIAVAQTDVDGMPASRVPGHAGRFVFGTLGGRRVLVQQGRIHLYEGHSARAVTASVRAFAELGVPRLLLTNAAGGLVREWEPGTLVRITDHVNLQGATPLERGEAGRGCPYDAELGRALDRAARRAGIELRAGVYAANEGPAYETPAEVRAALWMGAHAVGMSTALEALAAHAAGIRVAAVSLVANLAAGLSDAPLSHAEVVEASRCAAGRFTALLRAAVPELCSCPVREAERRASE